MAFVGLGLSLSNEGPLGDTLAVAQRADALGFDEVSLPESRQHRAVFSAAAATLATTRRTRVRIGIANPVTRHPAVLAMEAATLAEIAGPERLAFGVGAAVWTMRALGYEPAGVAAATRTSSRPSERCAGGSMAMSSGSRPRRSAPTRRTGSTSRPPVRSASTSARSTAG